MRHTAEHICIIGLGYVGLPLAVAYGAFRPTIGFDISAERIETLSIGDDRTREMGAAELAAAKKREREGH